MRRLTTTAALLALLLAACGPIVDDAPAADRTVDDATRERVKTSLYEHLVLKKAEVGPQFPEALPEIQDQVAAEAGFGTWENYLLCLRATKAGADLALTKEITERMTELLDGDDQIDEPR